MVRMLSVPPATMASRALTARLMITCSSWPWSTRTSPSSRPCTILRSIEAPISRRSRLESSASTSVIDSTFGCSVCWREKARSWRTRFAARLAFWRICMMSAKDWSPGRWRISRRSQNPIIAVSRLLKSWATPPASWPTSSIFCDCRNCASSVFCSVMSTRWRISPDCSLPSSSRRITVEATTLSVPPASVSSMGAASHGPAAARKSWSAREARPAGSTNAVNGRPFASPGATPTMRAKAALCSITPPSGPSSTMPTAASSKKRWKRCSDCFSASAHSRSMVRSRTSERVRSPLPFSACTMVWAT